MNGPGSDVLEILRTPGAGRPFLAGFDVAPGKRRALLTVHAARASMSARQAHELSSQLRASLGDTGLRIQRHGTRTLKRARSLQAFLRPFAHQQVAFDPTGVFGRAAMLVRFADLTRRACRDGVKRLLWHSESRTLFVVLDMGRLPKDSRDRLTYLATVERTVKVTLRNCCGSEGDRFVKSIRTGFRDPALPTIPIDIGSVVRPKSAIDRFTRKAWISSLAATLGIGVVAAKADETSSRRAVSGLNSELAIMGGVHDGDGAVLGEGAITTPLGDVFGARWDAAVGAIDGEFLGGGAGHLFWRDPEVGLLGIAGGHLWSEVDAPPGDVSKTGVAAAEGEFYFDRATISGLAGYQFSDRAGGDGFLGRMDFEWYLTDDVMFTSGLESNPDRNWLGRAGMEYRPGFDALPGLSVFAEGAFGDEGYHRAFGGIRFYFGQSTTLKERHRRDTFRSHLLPTRMVDSISAYGD